MCAHSYCCPVHSRTHITSAENVRQPVTPHSKHPPTCIVQCSDGKRAAQGNITVFYKVKMHVGDGGRACMRPARSASMGSRMSRHELPHVS